MNGTTGTYIQLPLLESKTFKRSTIQNMSHTTLIMRHLSSKADLSCSVFFDRLVFYPILQAMVLRDELLVATNFTGDDEEAKYDNTDK